MNNGRWGHGFEHQRIARAQYVATTLISQDYSNLDHIVKNIVDDIYNNMSYFIFGISA